MIYKGQKLEADIAYNEYEIAGEYEDVGKSGKSIEGRVKKIKRKHWNESKRIL